MGQALYRKYRSKSLSEIVGQDHIITTLQNALKQESISHAYLFTGPRGVGKTSIARILAHEINQLPYNEETSHIDIIEIDAASNRRIDEIRDLRDKVHVTPTSAAYKVYIIDEVHMLTREAFNALLKTLEEPPEHAIFILATTEAHKLPETIVSRTQRFSFRPIEPVKAVEHLRMIAEQEKIKVSDEALELIAAHGDGSFRDSIGLLDQVSTTSSKTIEADDIREMLGIAPQAAIEKLYELSQTGTPQAVLQHLTSLQDQGYEAPQIARQLSALLRIKLLEGKVEALSISHLFKQLVEVPASHDPLARLEIILLESSLRHAPTTTTIASPPTASEKPVAPKATSVTTSPKLETPAIKLTPKSATKAAKTTKAAQETPKALAEAWQSMLTAIKSQHNTLYGVVRMAEPRQTDNKVTLAFQFAFHQKRLTDAKNRSIVADLLQQELGQPIELVCIVEKDAKPDTTNLQDDPLGTAHPAPAEPPTASLDTISNIFGAAEVLES